MSQQYDNSNRGAVWPARERRTDKSPHYTGKANVGGVDYDVSVWEGEGGNKPAFSFRFTPQSERQNRQGAQPARETRGRQPAADVPDDDLPW